MSVLAKILSKPKRTFKQSRLPTPHALYGRFGITLKGNGWQMVRCPFHDDKHASLSINGTHGVLSAMRATPKVIWLAFI